jgi:hypothetical protein
MDTLNTALDALDQSLEDTIATSPDDLDIRLSEAAVQISLVAYRLQSTINHRATLHRLGLSIKQLPLTATV